MAAVRLDELAAVLGAHGPMLSAPDVDVAGGFLVLTVRVPLDGADTTALQHELEFMARAAQVRAFAQEYGVASPELDRLLVDASERRE